VFAALVIRSFRVLKFSSRSHSLEVTVSTLVTVTLHVCKSFSTRSSGSQKLSIGFQKQLALTQLVSRSSSLSLNWIPEAARAIQLPIQLRFAQLDPIRSHLDSIKQLVPFNFVLFSAACVWPTKLFLLQLHSRGEGVLTSLPICPARLWMFLFPSIR
jgi:hypothetical protein